MDLVSTALVDQAGTIATELSGMIADILPVALPVLGIGIAVTFGIKFIKKVMK